MDINYYLGAYVECGFDLIQQEYTGHGCNNSDCSQFQKATYGVGYFCSRCGHAFSNFTRLVEGESVLPQRQFERVLFCVPFFRQEGQHYYIKNSSDWIYSRHIEYGEEGVFEISEDTRDRAIQEMYDRCGKEIEELKRIYQNRVCVKYGLIAYDL